MQFQEEQDYTKRFDLTLWKRLLKYARPFYGFLAALCVCMVINAVVDVVFPMMTRYAIDNFIAKETVAGLGGFIALYLLLLLVQVLVIFGFQRCASKVEVGVCYTIRKLAFEKLQQLSFSFYDKTSVGYLMARMTSDTQRLADTIGWTLIDLVWGSVYMVLTAVAMLYYNWKLALLVLSVLPVLAVVSAYFQSVILKNHREVRKTNSRITGAFNEGIMGAKTTKTLVREDRNFEEFQVLTNTMRNSSVRAATFSSIYMPIVTSLGSIVTGLALWKGGYDTLSGAISLGTLVIFINYTVSFIEPVRSIANIFSEMQSAQAAAERVVSLVETEPDIVDGPEITAVYGDQFSPKRENWPKIHGDVDFEHVSFQYKGGEKVLSDFTLHVKAGQNIALVGETGSGKSTIVNLICRFYEPTEGSILIDGVDYRQRSQLWLQSHLGYVLQSPHLFSGTVRENIRYGRLDATDEEVERAAEMVRADHFISKLEKGYDTDVGEGGNRLSTGEKQLISFARAILANPAIFVLDEATSSIDTETEQAIQYAISKMLSGRTSFIVAHRLSTIKNADRILVISQGRVIEDGTHKQLLEKRGHYYTLYTNQFKEEGELSALGKSLEA